MQIRVKLYAHLRKRISGLELGKEATVDLDEGATPLQILQKLAIDPDEVKITMVNGSHAELDQNLHPNDLVVFFPPVGGG